MSYYIFIENDVINGSGQCQILNADVINHEVTEAQYNAFNENPDCYVLIDGVPTLDQNLLTQKQTAQVMTDAKAKRADAVSKITVEVDGMVFDGDKTAQQNMSEAVITAMSIGVKEINAQYKQAYESGELVGEYRYIPYEELTTPWVLADNTVATVTVGQLERALGQAKMQLTPLWIKPYQPEEPVSEEVSDGATDE